MVSFDIWSSWMHRRRKWSPLALGLVGLSRAAIVFEFRAVIYYILIIKRILLIIIKNLACHPDHSTLTLFWEALWWLHLQAPVFPSHMSILEAVPHLSTTWRVLEYDPVKMTLRPFLISSFGTYLTAHTCSAPYYFIPLSLVDEAQLGIFPSPSSLQA